MYYRIWKTIFKEKHKKLPKKKKKKYYHIKINRKILVKYQLNENMMNISFIYNIMEIIL